MVKKKIQMIWQAGLEDFAARRERAAAVRAGVVHEDVRHEPSRRMQALDRQTEEHVRRAVADATAPLRHELEALRRQVDGLREQVAKLKKDK
jgi:polyhydroxyalkanoate synthesis regulator phasin